MARFGTHPCGDLPSAGATTRAQQRAALVAIEQHFSFHRMYCLQYDIQLVRTRRLRSNSPLEVRTETGSQKNNDGMTR